MIKVMHVDADARTREMVDMVLCLTGEFVVLPCQTGEEAIAQLSVFGPEVVLIDLMQRGEHATETLAAIHATPEFQGIPVIFVAPDTDSVDIAAFRAAGAADVIAKPFDPVTLGDRIKEAMPAYV